MINLYILLTVPPTNPTWPLHRVVNPFSFESCEDVSCASHPLISISITSKSRVAVLIQPQDWGNGAEITGYISTLQQDDFPRQTSRPNTLTHPYLIHCRLAAVSTSPEKQNLQLYWVSWCVDFSFALPRHEILWYMVVQNNWMDYILDYIPYVQFHCRKIIRNAVMWQIN